MTEYSFHYENVRRRGRYAFVFTVMILALLLMAVININTGPVKISLKEIAGILFAGQTDGTEYDIIWQIRMPRILMAAILGGALSLSGFLLQVLSLIHI